MYASLLLLYLITATYTDLKSRIVPNWLSYSAIVAGLVLHAIQSSVENSLEPLAFSISGAAICFVFAYILWKIGAWAGGDVKLFTAIGALMPVFYPLTEAEIISSWLFVSLPLFPFLIFTNSILIALPFVVLYVIHRLIVRSPDYLLRFLRNVLRETIMLALSIYAAVFLMLSFGLHPISIPVMLIALALVKAKWLRYSIVALLSILNMMFGSLAYLPELLIGAFIAVMIFAFIGERKEIIQLTLREKVKLWDLEEGMIAGETLYTEKGKLKVREQPDLLKMAFRGKLKEILASTKPVKNELISERRAAGITSEEIKKLLRLRKQGKFSRDWIWVKQSVPMIPIVLLGSIASFIAGDILYVLI
jgi:preflagellin peptidase FlaK